MWKRWRYDTRQRISEGEEDWQQSARDLNAKMAAWRQATSTSSADESMRLTWEEMESVINASIQSVNKSLPAAMRIDFDTDTLLRDAMASVPQGIGVLGNTMNTVDTTAGFAEMLNLGLSPALSARYREEMDNFEQGMKVMQNLRMIDIIYEILGNFEYQLGEANQNNFDNVMTGLAYYYEAPFIRQEGRQWSIEVVRSHSLAATKYRTIRFQDYADFVNTTVVLKSLKGLDGTMIDFSDPTSYRGINSDDLAIYVKLEQAHLNREIENVLGEGGTFSTHSTDEFSRLQEDFNSAYESYVKGMALTSMGWYRTPIVPGGPDPMTAAKIGACFAGPWAAFAVNAALLVVDTRDGVIAGKHALMQGAVGLAAGMAGPAGILVNIAASGIEYEEGGGIGWSNRQFREGAVRNIASYALSNTLNGAMGPNFSNTALGTGLSAGISGFAMSGLTISSSGWNNMSFGFDTENWKEHATVGIASGISAAVTKSMSKKSNTGSERAQSGNKQGTSMMPEQWGDQFSQKVISGGINSLIMTASYHAFGGEGFKNDYSKMNWNNMAPSAYDLGNFLGSEANEWILSRQKVDPVTKQKKSSGIIEDWAAKALQLSNQGDKYAKDFFQSIGKLTVDGIMSVFKFSNEMENEIVASIQVDRRGKIDKNKLLSMLKKNYTKKEFHDVLDNMDNEDINPEMKETIKKVVKDMKAVDDYMEKNGNKLEAKLRNGRITSREENRLQKIFNNLDNVKEFNNYFDAKVRLRNQFGDEYELSEDDIHNLSRSVRQSKHGSTLGKQLHEYSGMSISQADKNAAVACKYENLYLQLKVLGATNKVEGKGIGSITDFYNLHGRGDNRDINGANIGTQGEINIIKQYEVNGKTIGMKTIKNYNTFINSTVYYGQVRFASEFGDWDHSAPSYYDAKQKRRELSDVSCRSKGLEVRRSKVKPGFDYFRYLYIK